MPATGYTVGMASDVVGVVYQQGFEPILQAGQVAQKPQLIEHLQRLGYDFHRPVTEYPPAVLLAVLDTVAREAFSEMTQDEAYAHIGHQAFRAFRLTLVGKVVLAALGMMDVERTLRLAIRGFNSTANFARHEVVREGPRRLIYRTHQALLPRAYVRGILDEMLDASRHAEVKLELGADTATHRDFIFTW